MVRDFSPTVKLQHPLCHGPIAASLIASAPREAWQAPALSH
jgi:hypothetical protein